MFMLYASVFNYRGLIAAVALGGKNHYRESIVRKAEPSGSSETFSSALSMGMRDDESS